MVEWFLLFVLAIVVILGMVLGLRALYRFTHPSVDTCIAATGEIDLLFTEDQVLRCFAWDGNGEHPLVSMDQKILEAMSLHVKTAHKLRQLGAHQQFEDAQSEYFAAKRALCAMKCRVLTWDEYLAHSEQMSTQIFENSDPVLVLFLLYNTRHGYTSSHTCSYGSEPYGTSARWYCTYCFI